MECLNAALAMLAVVISAAAFWRTLFLDKVVADLVFKWDATLGCIVGKLMIENPLRHSVYISSIGFEEPARQDVVVTMNGSGLYDVVSDAYEETVSSDNGIAVINARIPPKDSLELELELKKNGTGLSITFNWSTAMPRYMRFLVPKRLKYSARDIEAWKRAAKRGEPQKEP